MKFWITLSLIVPILTSSVALAAEESGSVLSVYDGDTFRVRTDGGRQAIRLRSVDAPELAPPPYTVRRRIPLVDQRQPLALAARERLRVLLPKDSVVTLDCLSQPDLYKRRVCRVLNSQGTDVGATLLSEGLAHTLRPDSRDAVQYEALVRDARDRRVGVWANLRTELPVVYRARLRALYGRSVGPEKNGL